MQTSYLLQRITEIAESIKTQKITTLDLTEKSAETDFFFICQANSIGHAKGIAEKIEYVLKQEKIYPLGIEGRTGNEWILMDYNSVVVHIFLASVRHLYDFEKIHAHTMQERL